MFVRLIKIFFGVVVAGVDRLGGVARKLLGIRRPPRLVIIYYHAIRSKLKEPFAWQMAELARLTTPLDLESTTTLSPGERHSAVTFDDGFISVVDNALPVLEKLGIACTIFVPSGSLGTRPKWIKPSHEDGQEIVASAELVRELAAHPLVRIGSHSVSHPDFRRLDDAQAVEEFTASKQALEQVTGREVTTFSFPHGAYTHHSLELARQCGYSQVFTIEPRQLTGLDAFTMGRVRVEPSDWPIEFRLKVLGAYRWMVHASALKCRLRTFFKGSVPDLPAGA
jgi:peptidoglycan/xylan/chitin deacetylase (PgdA/CDA1 family)